LGEGVQDRGFADAGVTFQEGDAALPAQNLLAAADQSLVEIGAPDERTIGSGRFHR